MSGFTKPMATAENKYLRIESGETVRLRIASQPITFEKDFGQGDGPKKRCAVIVIRKEKIGDEIKRSPIVFEFGAMIYNDLVKLNLDEDFGDLTTYDIKVTKTGSDKTTKYSITPDPNKSPLTREDKSLAATINLCEACGVTPGDENDPFKD